MRTKLEPSAVTKIYSTFEEMPEVFNNIYETNKWRKGDGSGVGSEPKNARVYLDLLEDYIKTYEIKTITDFGCGSWQVYTDFDWPDIDHYYGIDVSDISIQRAKTKCNKENFEFLQISNYKNIPISDLLIVKEVFQHWPLNLVDQFIEDMFKQFKYVFVVGPVENTFAKEHHKNVFLYTEAPHAVRETVDIGYWLFKNEV